MSYHNLNPATLGEHLRIARSKANLTQEAAAAALGLSRTTLISIEGGQRRARAHELIELAELYGTTVGHLVSADSVHVDLTTKFRRLENKPKQNFPSDSVALLNSLVSGALELERALGVELKYDYPPPVRILGQGYLQQAEDVAIALRNRMGVGLGRLEDLLTVLELDLGIRVFFRPLRDPDVSGLYAFDQMVGACILVNSNHHWRRRMQTLAHEVGHFVSERSTVDIIDEASFELSVSERFARRFGAALLMPAPSLRSRFDQLLVDHGNVDVRGLVLLSHQYGVATEAMCRRLEDLDLLAQGTWLSIRDRGFSAEYERDVLGDPHPDVPPPMVSPRLAYLGAEALDKELLSEGQLCEMLVLDRVQLRRAIRPFQRADSV